VLHSRTSTVGLKRKPDEGENSPKLKTSVGRRSSDREWFLMEPSKEGKRGRDRAVKREGEAVGGRETPASV
jgi:hypothetical protein